MAAVDALCGRIRLLELQARKGLDNGTGVCLKRIVNGILVPSHKVLEFLLRMFDFLLDRHEKKIKRGIPHLEAYSSQIEVKLCTDSRGRIIHVEGELAREERPTLCESNLFVLRIRRNEMRRKRRENGEMITPPQLTGI